MNLETFSAFFDYIQKASNILILCSKPDGDSVGASNALNSIIKKLGRNVTSFAASQIAEYLLFLVNKGSLKYTDILSEDLTMYDLVIIVDTDSLSRSLNGKGVEFNKKAKFIVIDHHQPSIYKTRMDLELVDPETESTCGIITDAAWWYKETKGIDLLDSQSALQLYAGIVSDTDYFAYATVTKETFERATYLMNYPFDIEEIILKFRETLSTKAFSFIQRFLPKVIVNKEQKYTYLKILKTDLTEEDNLAVINEAANFLNRAIIRIIDDINFSFILREVNETKSSLAFRLHNNGNNIDLSEIATHFGGGGHKKAAGAVVEMNVNELEKELIQYLEKEAK